jgi:hypothetical protein
MPVEVVEVHWPMDVPAHAKFAVASPQPLKISGPYTLQIQALSPVHIYSEVPLKIIPAGPATAGFAKGWLKLPNELKLAILRYNILLPTSLWPANINTVIRRELLPYLRMTSDIAELAQAVFYQENRFILQFSSSRAHRHPYSSSTLARPPVIIRPLLRRVTFLTRLTNMDWRILRWIGDFRAGFANVVHLEVRCLLWEVAVHLRGVLWSEVEKKSVFERKDSEFRLRRGPPIQLPFGGVVTFDRSGEASERIPQLEEMIDGWLQHVEGLVMESFLFDIV